MCVWIGWLIRLKSNWNQSIYGQFVSNDVYSSVDAAAISGSPGSAVDSAIYSLTQLFTAAGRLTVIDRARASLCTLPLLQSLLFMSTLTFDMYLGG